MLCISDDVAGASKPGRHFPITDYALSKGVTLRDDSIMVQPPPNSWYHSEMAQEFWPRLPVILEHEHYGASKQRGAWGDGSLLLKAVEEYHASYMSIHWWPREFLNENREIINNVNKRIGYRFQLHQIKIPESIAIGETFTFETQWANAGVAPLYKGGFLALTLKDEKEGIASVNVDDSFDFSSLKPSSTAINYDTVTVSSKFVIGRKFVDKQGVFKPAIKPGHYDAFISIGLADGTPKIALPLDDEDGNRRYKIGKIYLNEL